MQKKSRLQRLPITLMFVLGTVSLQAQIGGPKTPITTAPAQCHHLRAGNSLITNIEAEEFTQAEIRVENANGKVLMTKPIVLDPGKNALKFMLSEMQPGVYFIKIASAKGLETITIAVK